MTVVRSTAARVVDAIQLLRSEGVEPILYGSAGASLYLGEFKPIADIDLLIEDRLLHEDWKSFVRLMEKHGFSLFDEREHEFVDTRGEKLSFAESSILVKDKICDPSEELVKQQVASIAVTTLSPRAFRNAYLFSAKDGYRQKKRVFKDKEVIELFDRYMSAKKGA